MAPRARRKSPRGCRRCWVAWSAGRTGQAGVAQVGAQRLEQALAEQAPQVPVHRAAEGIDAAPTDGRAVLAEAVRIAHELSEQGDTVLLAPAAASMDQFASYADRGEVFIDLVAGLVRRLGPAEQDRDEEGPRP
mgnify:CR=1 FL=1